MNCAEEHKPKNMARTMLIYGVTGSHKTSQCAQIARWLHESYGGIVRHITSDSGVAPAQDEIDAGIIHPWKLSGCTMPIAVVKRVSKGFWTDDLDTSTGIGDQQKMRETTGNEFRGIAGYIVEGLTTNAALYLTDSERKGRSVGEPLQGLDKLVLQKELGETYLMSSRATFHGAQRFTADYVDRFKGLPVPWVIFTAHESRGEDDNDRPCLGPAVQGKALNHVVGGWFENTIHAVKYPYTVLNKKHEKINKMGVRFYFVEHADATYPRMSWPAKLGVPLRIQAAVEEKWEGGYIPSLINSKGVPVSGLRNLMDIIDPAPDSEGLAEGSGVNEEVIEPGVEVIYEPEPEQPLAASEEVKLA